MARGKKKTVIDTAHPHTIKKFELIEEYIKSWSQKLMGRKITVDWFLQWFDFY